jgi:hypothetical protein
MDRPLIVIGSVSGLTCRLALDEYAGKDAGAPRISRLSHGSPAVMPPPE